MTRLYLVFFFIFRKMWNFLIWRVFFFIRLTQLLEDVQRVLSIKIDAESEETLEIISKDFKTLRKIWNKVRQRPAVDTLSGKGYFWFFSREFLKVILALFFFYILYRRPVTHWKRSVEILNTVRIFFQLLICFFFIPESWGITFGSFDDFSRQFLKFLDCWTCVQIL